MRTNAAWEVCFEQIPSKGGGVRASSRYTIRNKPRRTMPRAANQRRRWAARRVRKPLSALIAPHRETLVGARCRERTRIKEQEKTTRSAPAPPPPPSPLTEQLQRHERTWTTKRARSLTWASEGWKILADAVSSATQRHRRRNEQAIIKAERVKSRTERASPNQSSYPPQRVY